MSQRTRCASNAGTIFSSGAEAARSLRTRASAVSPDNSEMSSGGVAVSTPAVTGRAAGAGGRLDAHAERPAIALHRTNRRYIADGLEGVELIAERCIVSAQSGPPASAIQVVSWQRLARPFATRAFKQSGKCLRVRQNAPLDHR